MMPMLLQAASSAADVGTSDTVLFASNISYGASSWSSVEWRSSRFTVSMPSCGCGCVLNLASVTVCCCCCSRGYQRAPHAISHHHRQPPTVKKHGQMRPGRQTAPHPLFHQRQVQNVVLVAAHQRKQRMLRRPLRQHKQMLLRAHNPQDYRMRRVRAAAAHRPALWGHSLC